MNKNDYYFQIDILKALAILSVIVLHTAASKSLVYNLTFNQAIPVFFVILGFNMGMSFRRRGYVHLNQMFTLEYFKARFKRLVLPVIVIFAISWILGWILNKQLYFGVLSFIGYLPFSGPGNYFISIALEFIFIFPFLYYFYNRNPRLTLIFSFLLTFLFEVLAFTLPIFSNNTYIYKASIFRYLFAITLGLWAIDYVNFEKIKENKFIIGGSLFSISYIILYSLLGWNFPYFEPYWGTQNVLSFFYPLLLFILGMKYLPKVSTNKISDLMGKIGKASYHIFLVQILFFGFGCSLLKIFLSYNIPKTTLNIILMGVSSLIVNISIVLILGLLFFSLENRLLNSFNNGKNRHIK